MSLNHGDVFREQLKPYPHSRSARRNAEGKKMSPVPWLFNRGRPLTSVCIVDRTVILVKHTQHYDYKFANVDLWRILEPRDDEICKIGCHERQNYDIWKLLLFGARFSASPFPAMIHSSLC